MGPVSYCQRTKIIYAARKKLVATANRCEGVYNRAGEPSVTFCERGATPASAAGGGYSERELAQRPASGRAALSADDGAGHRKRAGSGVSEL